MEAVQSGSHTQRRRTTEAAVAFQNIQGTVFVFDKLKQDVPGQSDGRAAASMADPFDIGAVYAVVVTCDSPWITTSRVLTIQPLGIAFWERYRSTLYSRPWTWG
jgi:hypothetical protein